MATIVTASVDANKIKQAANEKGYTKLSIIINDELDKGNENFTPKYPQNVKVIIGQTQEDIKKKAKKTYVGNGQTVWSQDGLKTAKEMKEEDDDSNQNTNDSNDEDDEDEIPF